MFVDIAKVHIKAGNGGNGAVSFHREKYVAAGGPDGGDGGKGGNVVMIADKNLSTLADFRYKRKYVAPNGGNGGTKRCSGKKGEDLILKVPFGTLVKEESTGKIIADVSTDEPVIVAYGGNGGWGNTHFATATRQIPRYAKDGLPGDEFDAVLELKLLADVGLIGFPNVGKSTLISVVSEAKPKIANYHFTTLSPVLGVVRPVEDKSFVMADIPGLVEGAADGVGLGHEFLRHVERCRLLLHVLDISGSEGRDPIEDFDKINSELKNFSEELSTRKQIVVANKCDLAEPEKIEEYKKYFEEKGYEFYEIMAPINEGTQKLMLAVLKNLADLPPIKQYDTEPFVKPENAAEINREFSITVKNGVYEVSAPWIMKIMNNTNPDDYESLQYFERVLRESGIIDKLREMGVKNNDSVNVEGIEFDYIE